MVPSNPGDLDEPWLFGRSATVSSCCIACPHGTETRLPSFLRPSAREATSEATSVASCGLSLTSSPAPSRCSTSPRTPKKSGFKPFLDHPVQFIRGGGAFPSKRRRTPTQNQPGIYSSEAPCAVFANKRPEFGRPAAEASWCQAT